VSRPKFPTLSTAKSADVRAFVKVARELEEWKQKYPGPARALAEIAERYAPAHKAAEGSARAAEASIGPFVVKHAKLKAGWPTRFADVVGRTEFLRLGGTITPSEIFTFDPERFDGICDREEYEPERVAKIAEWVIVYDKPGELVLP
jgi:hypothetical protein